MGVPQESFESETQKLMEEADFFLMSTHFFWGMWSFHTAAVSEIEFSYMVSVVTIMQNGQKISLCH